MSMFIEISEKDKAMVNLYTERRDGKFDLWAVIQVDALVELGVDKDELQNAGRLVIRAFLN